MSTSPISGLYSTNALDVLASAASTAAQLQSKINLDLISNQIQKQLNTQIAALQAAPDSAVTGAMQSQIASLQKQLNVTSSMGSQYGANANVLSDLQDQLSALQTAAGSGDSAGFDLALASANIDVEDLTVIAPTAPYQPDQVTNLQGNGLGIGSSASYDLSTPAGQAAAAAAIQSAQDLVGQVFAATTSNQVLAGSRATALSSQVSTLTSNLSDLQQTNQLDSTTKALQLTQQAQNQLHLIQLALGNSQLLATAITNALNPPQPYTSPLDALAGAGSTQPTAPAVLSIMG